MKQHHYTAQDIRRYHSGGMSAAERHAIEKAALEDPFLADALEGYQYAADPVAEIQAIQKRLDTAAGRKKGRVVAWNNTWMRAAALVILLAGAGWLVSRSFVQKTNDLANTTATSVPAVEKTETREEAENASGNDDMAAEMNTTETAGNAVQKPAILGNVTRTQQPPPAVPDSAQVNTTSITFASPTMALQRNAARSEDQQVSARAKATNDTLSDIVIVLQENGQPFNDVIVLGKNRKIQKTELKFLGPEQPEPIEGWDSYNEYVVANLREPEELKLKPAAGDVVLSFEIDAAGNPSNITVLKSLCETCDEEAIRILRQGPKWKNNRKKGRVAISFRN